MKRILITGENSYIGMSVENWLNKWPEDFHVNTISVRDDSWKEKDFSEYDVIFHVAAVVHQKDRPEMAELYFKVNRDLPVKVAIKAKNNKVRQFIFMSTMAVYGEEGRIDQEVVINFNSPVNPKSLYGISKFSAEAELDKLSDAKFKVTVLRPPMVYGPNCPGNYARLENLAIRLPVFPMIENKRSMLHIDKLCQTLKEIIDKESEGIFLPQDDEFITTSLMVRDLATKNGKSIHLSKILGYILKLLGKRFILVNKVFGNLVYEKKEVGVSDIWNNLT